MNTLELLRAVATGRVSAREVCDAALVRIEASDARVNAFTERTVARARREADAVDAARARGDALPLLAGLPYAVKNLFDVAGLRTLAGSRINRDLPPALADAVLVQRLQAAGAVLVGALNMDEYAYGFTTENTHYGATRNPHDATRIAGGSSGGCGAAVAARQVPLALAYDAMQGPDPLDPGCQALRVQPTAPLLVRGAAGLRVGVLGGYFHENASAPARAAAATAGQVLGARAQVEWPDAALGRAAAFLVTASEGGSLHLPDLRTRPQDFEPLSVDRFIAGALQPADWSLRAQRFRRVYRDRVNALFRDWDVLVAPATPVGAPLIGSEWIEVNGVRHPSRPAMGLLTQPVSFAGCPVVVAPLWPEGTGGLPLGVQLIAAPWREDLCLRAGQVLQDAGAAHL